MESDRAVIGHRNAQLRNELSAINRSLLHARLLKHGGLGSLGHHAHEEAVEDNLQSSMSSPS